MNECYTYFNVTGDFEPDELIKAIDLTPFRAIKKNTPRPDGKGRYEFSSCDFCRNDDYCYDVNVMIAKSIAPLRDKIKLLNDIREKLGVQYCIEVVPQIYTGESTPAFGPNLDIIDFCHAIRATVDIDLYVFDE